MKIRIGTRKYAICARRATGSENILRKYTV
jgi:hypothetical protein